MLVLLPPSETKRSGGTGPSLSLESLQYPELSRRRREVAEALVSLAEDPEATARALKLGPRQQGEVEANRALWQSPTASAIDRYAGVLFDALDPNSLGADERRFAGEHVVIHSALFGLISSLDSIPRYRISHNSRVPGVSLTAVWREAIRSLIREHEGLVLDLRSRGYADLGPAESDGSVSVRVEKQREDGSRTVVNHFNKAEKGRLTRALVRSGVRLGTTAELLEWARSAGFHIEEDSRGGPNLTLVV